jgi:Holliday junction resolvase|tara:strand:+ start:302 stop:631 length:330 start_codon:yes stop_codon:yes gene_type:complete
MPSKSKAKGNRFERLVVDMLEDQKIKAVRAWGSNGAALGCHEEVDVLVMDKIKVQCKCRHKLANYIIPSEHVDIQIIKEDRGVPLVVIPMKDYIKLLRESTNVESTRER